MNRHQDEPHDEGHEDSHDARLRIIIADDERPARHYVRGILQTFDDVDVVGEAASGTEAVALIERERPDLALLDLQMPELNGIEVVHLLRKETIPRIAFVTAYDEYAVRAFEINAVDYLLKPVDSIRLRRTIDRVLEDRARRRTTAWKTTHGDASTFARLEAASAAMSARPFATPIRRIPVRRRDDIVFVTTEDIASIVADGELLWLTTVRGERSTITYRLKDLEARVDPEQFIRVSRSALVNADAIAKVSPMPGATLLLTLVNKQEVMVSRTRSRILRETLLRL